MKYPLTLRGTLALFGGVYLFLGPATNAADLVAALLGLALIIFGIILATISIVGALVIKKKLAPSIHAPDGKLLSRQPTKIIINAGTVSVPSLFLLKLKLSFVKGLLTPTTHELIGSAKKDRILIDEISFPHRGNWVVSDIHVSFTDRFGLSNISWVIPLSNVTIRVEPSGESNSYIPILSSSQRDGDDVEHPLERTGDPYDLKQYHPSDGMRKILWKVFAKSGELISRHPEKSMSPEGKAVILILAEENDDQVCQMALKYVEQLRSFSIETWTACSGIANSSQTLGRDVDSTNDLLIDTVWNSNWSGEVKKNGSNKIQPDGTINADLNYLLSNLPKSGGTLTSILVFLSQHSISSESAVHSLSSLGSDLSSIGIEPIFCIDTAQVGSATEPSVLNTFPKLRSFLLGSSKESFKEPIKYYPNFIKVCAQSNWQVIV